ncbi:hypothetical protein ANCDUO_16971, partial [Ancylostoma duodenale]
MSDSVKKPKSSLLLYLLVVVSVLVLLCAATILYLVAGSRTLTEQSQNATSSQLFLVPDSTPATFSSSAIPPRPTRPIPARTTTTAAAALPAPLPSPTSRTTTTNAPATTVTTSTRATTTPTAETATLLEYTTTTNTAVPESAEVTSPEPEEQAAQEIITTGSHTDANAEVVDKCARIVAQRVTCPKTRDDV